MGSLPLTVLVPLCMLYCRIFVSSNCAIFESDVITPIVSGVFGSERPNSMPHDTLDIFVSATKLVQVKYKPSRG